MKAPVAVRVPGASRGTPSTDTTGNVETLMVPYWLVKVTEPPASLLLRDATDLVVEGVVDGHVSVQLNS